METFDFLASRVASDIQTLREDWRSLKNAAYDDQVFIDLLFEDDPAIISKMEIQLALERKNELKEFATRIKQARTNSRAFYKALGESVKRLKQAG